VNPASITRPIKQGCISSQRQLHYESGAGDFAGGAGAILGEDAAAQRFDDLFGDRKPSPEWVPKASPEGRSL